MTLERSSAVLGPDEFHRLDEFRRQHRTALLTVGFVDLVHSTELAELTWTGGGSRHGCCWVSAWERRLPRGRAAIE